MQGKGKISYMGKPTQDLYYAPLGLFIELSQFVKCQKLLKWPWADLTG